jgi:hypothetical protein
MHKLIYRGVTYNYAAPNATVAAPANDAKVAHHAYKLSYRGASYTVDPNVEAKRSIFHPIAHLMYRGVAYSMNG